MRSKKNNTKSINQGLNTITTNRDPTYIKKSKKKKRRLTQKAGSSYTNTPIPPNYEEKLKELSDKESTMMGKYTDSELNKLKQLIISKGYADIKFYDYGYTNKLIKEEATRVVNSKNPGLPKKRISELADKLIKYTQKKEIIRIEAEKGKTVEEKIKKPWIKSSMSPTKSISATGNFFYQGALKYSSKIFNKEYQECNLIKELEGNERSEFRVESLENETLRRSLEHDFFKREDDYFKGLLRKNMRNFCFNNKEETDEKYYSRFCSNMIRSCLKTPLTLHEVLFDAIDPLATKRMFFHLPKLSRESLIKRIQTENSETFNEKLDENSSDKDIMALTLSFIQDDNLHTLSMYFVNVIIKSIVDYKEAQEKAPEGTYTGNIILESYIDDMLHMLLKKSEQNNTTQQNNTPQNNTTPNPNTNQQEGGAYNVTLKEIKKKTVKKGSYFTPSELKKITENDIYEGLKKCDKRDLIKRDYETKLENGITGTGDEYLDDDDVNAETMGENLETSKLLYILIGCLTLVGVIESGFFDAPPCLSHTII